MTEHAPDRGVNSSVQKRKSGARELLTSIRCRDQSHAWIEIYRTLDEGEHWRLENIPAPENPKTA